MVILVVVIGELGATSPGHSDIKKDGGGCHKIVVLVPLRVFSLKMSAAAAFEVPVMVLGQKKK